VGAYGEESINLRFINFIAKRAARTENPKSEGEHRFSKLLIYTK